MRRSVCRCISLLLIACVAARDIGVPNWKCDPSVMGRSKTVPTSAHQVRWGDIDVVMALGDSLTAGNGAGASGNDAVEVLLQYRGLSFSAGGQYSLDQHVTIPNILRVFNPNLAGYAVGTGSANVWEVARLNNGVPGDESGQLLQQARGLVAKLLAHPDVIDMKNHWKLLNIFIGGNDLCGYCDPNDAGGPAGHTGDVFRDNIAAAVQFIQANVPRVIVNLVSMFDMGMLRRVDNGEIFCQGLHVFECPCESNKNFTNPEMTAVCQSYMKSEAELQDGRFDTADDFTLVIQPFFNGVKNPPLLANGSTDLAFFAPDCFHFSQLGHALVSKVMWNTMIQPVGTKQTTANLSDYTVALNCPDTRCPFVPTTKNSGTAACAKLWTEPA